MMFAPRKIYDKSGVAWQGSRLRSRMPLGPELRDARERAGLSVEQIAARTRVKLQEIVALESDSLTYLPDETYLEGLILSYAAEVGLNAAPVVERVRIERERYERDWDARGESEEVLRQPQAVTSFESINTGQRAPGRRLRRERLLLPLMSVLAITGWTAYFLESGLFKRQTTVSPSSAVAEPAHPSSVSADPAAGPEPALASPAPTPPAVVSVDSRAPAANDVSGRWTLETRVGSSSLKRFAGLQLGYSIDLNQKGERVTGTGKKISENGKILAVRAQTPIRLAGRMKDNQLILSFTEGGRQRLSKGGFAMQLDESGALRGRFSSNAARSSGTAEAFRPLPRN